jgi:hypothetical protein
LRLIHWTTRKLQGWTVLNVTKRDEVDTGLVATAAKNYEAWYTCRASCPRLPNLCAYQDQQNIMAVRPGALLLSSNKFESEKRTYRKLKHEP